MTKYSKYLSKILILVIVSDGVIKGKRHDNTAFLSIKKRKQLGGIYRLRFKNAN
jgi:hypothetical protein